METKETHTDNNIKKMKIIKLTAFIFAVGVIAMIVSLIIMTIGIIQFDLKKYASSITVVYLVTLLSLIIQWIPLWSIYQMLKDIKTKKIE